jgi:hypothetical protein
MDCYYVFIVSSPRAGTLRTGLTCDLAHRLERLRGEAPPHRVQRRAWCTTKSIWMRRPHTAARARSATGAASAANA